VEPDAYLEGINSWQMDLGETLETVFQHWSPPLRAACFAALKQRGNTRRQAVLREKVQTTLNDPKCANGLRRWASIAPSSYLQPYWHLPNVEAARRMVQVRLDCAPTEDYMRRRTANKYGKKIERLDDRVMRACYCCNSIMGVGGIYRPETLEHVLLHCGRPVAVARREEFRFHLVNLMQRADFIAVTGGVPPPVLTAATDDARHAADTAFLTLLRLCMGQGMTQHHWAGHGSLAQLTSLRLPKDVMALAQRARAQRALPEFVYDADAALAATRWMDVLFNGWMDSIRSPNASTLPMNTPGCRLATCVAEHVQQVFRDRRVFLKEDDDYQSRKRDPSDVVAVARALRG